MVAVGCAKVVSGCWWQSSFWHYLLVAAMLPSAFFRLLSSLRWCVAVCDCLCCLFYPLLLCLCDRYASSPLTGGGDYGVLCDRYASFFVSFVCSIPCILACSDFLSLLSVLGMSSLDLCTLSCNSLFPLNDRAELLPFFKKKYYYKLMW
jgi:hypothetical protein